MADLKYTITYPKGMTVGEPDDSAKMEVYALIEFEGMDDPMQNTPKRAAVVKGGNIPGGGYMIYGERQNGDWVVNWNISRALVNILIQLTRGKTNG